tara:strand:+ start:174 stop:392 length:219 start_codon:yes stop_codon:yes gene_type:complete
MSMKFAMDWAGVNDPVPVFFNRIESKTAKAYKIALRLEKGGELVKWLPKKHVNFSKEHEDTVWIDRWLYDKI